MRALPAPRTRVFWALAMSLVAILLLAGCSTSPSNNNNSTAPTISSLTPNQGVVGASVTIAGTNFGASQGTSTVTFNGTSAGTASSWSATSIAINVPTGATSGNVVVTVNGTASNGASFTVLVPPSITLLNPNQAPVGATVTITGTGFGSPQGTSTVKFNGTAATASAWTATSITVTVPNGAATGNVVVTVGGLASGGSAFTVLPSPSITSLGSPSGSIGSSLTITGTNFGASQGTSTVNFNGTSAGNATAWSATSITVNVPSGATSGNVVVTVNGGPSNGVAFTVAPFITNLSRSSGAVGTAVTITGLNFGATQGASTVAFNGTVATTVTAWSAISITANVPTGATTGSVVVTVGALASNGVSFTIVVPPGITSLSVTQGSVGDAVTITGTAFGASQGSSSVTFNGTSAGTASAWSDTSVTVTVPTGATTGPVVVVVNGASSNSIGFTVAPVISSLNPSSGGITSSVTIAGANFGASQGASTVTFNSIPATATAWSDTGITATVPTGATTGNVVVTVGGLASNGVNFTVTLAPVITSLSPNLGGVTTSVTISGTNFGASQGASTVTFNGTSAGTASAWSATSITVAVPAAASLGNVVVTVGGVASNGIPFDVTLSCPLTAGGKENLLNGGFVFSVDGFVDSKGSPAGTGPFQATGVFKADGAGTVTAGELDSGHIYSTSFNQQTISSGCYNLGSDQRGYMFWNLSGGGSATFAISVRNDGTLGHVILFDDFNPGTSPATRGEGTFKKQTLTTFSASNFSGSYAFGFTGANNDTGGTPPVADYQRMAAVGVLTAGGSALTISNAVIDIAQVNNGALQNVDDVPEAATGSGFTAPDSFGRGTLTVAVSSASLGCSGTCTATFSYYIVSASDIYLQGLGGNNNPMWNGEALSQTGTFGSAGALSGTAILSATGEDVINHNYTVLALGQVSSNGSGSVSAFLDKVSNGTVQSTGTTQITGGAFTVSANGLGSVTIGSAGSTQPFSVAMVTQNTGFVLEGTAASPAVNIMTGTLVPQTVTTTVSSAHAFALGTGDPADSNANVQVGSLTTSSPNFTGTADDSAGLNCSTGCLNAGQAIGGTYTVDSNGRISITVTGGGGGTAVGWVLDTTDFVAFSPDTNAAFFIFNQ